MIPLRFGHVLESAMEEPCRSFDPRRCSVPACLSVGTSPPAAEAQPEGSQVSHHRQYPCRSHLPDHEEVMLPLFYAFFSGSSGAEASVGCALHSAAEPTAARTEGCTGRTKRATVVIGPSPELTNVICQLLGPLPGLWCPISTSSPSLVAEPISTADGD